MLKYYILSVKWSNGDNLVWWRPDDKGYTSFLEDAGIYTQDQVLGNLEHYNNGHSTLAIPVIHADVHRKTIVPYDKIHKLKETVKQYIDCQLQVRDN